MENKTLEQFLKISKARMYNHYLPKLLQSINVLKTEELWRKEGETLNTIGGIVLHICEHIKRNALRFSSQNHNKFDQGIEDYFPNLGITTDELLKIVQETFEGFNSVMVRLIVNIPYEFDMHSLFHLIEHTGYHLGQIVFISKKITGSPFNFCQNGINEKKIKAIIDENKNDTFN